MKLIITSTINKLELQVYANVFELDLIKVAAKKCVQGLGKDIKSSKKIAGTRLKKMNITSSAGAGRVVFLLKVSEEKSVLVMVRHKNDKQIGANMAIDNPQFEKTLDKNLDIILADLQRGNYEEFDLQGR